MGSGPPEYTRRQRPTPFGPQPNSRISCCSLIRNGKLLDDPQFEEGMAMDPDLDPNLQHWQDRMDNFQWVVGSLVSLLDSVPT